MFIDHAGAWCLEFKANCDALGHDNRCIKYEDRPNVCKEHGKGQECDYYHAEEAPYVVNFDTAEQFEEYLKNNGKQWRFKRS